MRVLTNRFQIYNHVMGEHNIRISKFMIVVVNLMLFKLYWF